MPGQVARHQIALAGGARRRADFHRQGGIGLPAAAQFGLSGGDPGLALVEQRDWQPEHRSNLPLAFLALAAYARLQIGHQCARPDHAQALAQADQFLAGGGQIETGFNSTAFESGQIQRCRRQIRQPVGGGCPRGLGAPQPH